MIDNSVLTPHMIENPICLEPITNLFRESMRGQERLELSKAASKIHGDGVI